MTQAQKDALKQIKHLMREHFESGIAIVTYVTEEETEGTYHTRHGGFGSALGMLKLAETDLLREHNENQKEYSP